MKKAEEKSKTKEKTKAKEKPKTEDKSKTNTNTKQKSNKPETKNKAISEPEKTGANIEMKQKSTLLKDSSIAKSAGITKGELQKTQKLDSSFLHDPQSQAKIDYRRKMAEKYAKAMAEDMGKADRSSVINELIADVLNSAPEIESSSSENSSSSESSSKTETESDTLYNIPSLRNSNNANEISAKNPQTSINATQNSGLSANSNTKSSVAGSELAKTQKDDSMLHSPESEFVAKEIHKQIEIFAKQMAEEMGFGERSTVVNLFILQILAHKPKTKKQIENQGGKIEDESKTNETAEGSHKTTDTCFDIPSFTNQAQIITNPQGPNKSAASKTCKPKPKK